MKKRKEPVFVNVWGSKSRGAKLALVCQVPLRQAFALCRRNKPFYACLQFTMPDGSVRRWVSFSVLLSMLEANA